jgi:tRNA(fMet)-specific endonuclease VapC
MYLLDTDTLTRAHAGYGTIADRINKVGEERVATSIITAIEILRGRQDFLFKAADGPQLLQAQRLFDFSQQMLDDIRIYAIDVRVADEFDKLRQNKKLKKIGRGDLLIACIALANRATRVTRNTKHFLQVPGLKIENWLE